MEEKDIETNGVTPENVEQQTENDAVLESNEEETETNVNSETQTKDVNNLLEDESLSKEIDQLKSEKEDLYQRLLRLQAEYDNYKKRTQKEKLADRTYRSQDLAAELLPALDNFERALKVEVSGEATSFVEGMAMVYRQLLEALKSQGIVEIETVGKEFDPNVHHAVMQVEDEEIDSNIIVEELQKGYLLKDRVIRPAMVKVNK